MSHLFAAMKTGFRAPTEGPATAAKCVIPWFRRAFQHQIGLGGMERGKNYKKRAARGKRGRKGFPAGLGKPPPRQSRPRLWDSAMSHLFPAMKRDFRPRGGVPATAAKCVIPCFRRAFQH